MLSANNIKELVDPVLGDAYDEEQMKLVILTASLCIEQSSIQRPQMSEACPLHMRNFHILLSHFCFLVFGFSIKGVFGIGIKMGEKFS